MGENKGIGCRVRSHVRRWRIKSIADLGFTAMCSGNVVYHIFVYIIPRWCNGLQISLFCKPARASTIRDKYLKNDGYSQELSTIHPGAGRHSDQA